MCWLRLVACDRTRLEQQAAGGCNCRAANLSTRCLASHSMFTRASGVRVRVASGAVHCVVGVCRGRGTSDTGGLSEYFVHPGKALRMLFVTHTGTGTGAWPRRRAGLYACTLERVAVLTP